MTGQDLTRIGLQIEPLDPLFFRRGRPFGAGFTAVAALPLPQTLAGALRTMLLREAGCDFGRLRDAVAAGRSFQAACDQQGAQVAGVGRMVLRGPWLCTGNEPVVPIPHALARNRETGELVRLDPLRSPLPGWTGMEAGMLPLWPRRDRGRRDKRIERLEGTFITLKGLQDFLSGGVPTQHDIFPGERLYDIDYRTGIAVDGGTGTAAESMIYGAGFLALRPSVTFYAELQTSDAGIASPFDVPRALPFGGEGRRAQLVKRAAAEWPSVSRRGGDGTVLVLTTPAPFPEGWKPPGVSPIAAAVSGHVPFSGWDLARGGPKPTRFAVEAGGVYFLSGPDAGPDRTSGSLCEGDDEQAGWGAFVRGVWNYA